MTSPSDQFPIIVKEDWRKPATFEVQQVGADGDGPRSLRWFFGRKTKVVGKISVPGFGEGRELKTIGKDPTTLESRRWPNTNFRVRNVTDIKRWFRRLRPEEAGKLQLCDQAIESLHRQLVAVRAERQAVLKEAWQRGHHVTWKELYEQAEANEAESAAKIAAAKGL